MRAEFAPADTAKYKNLFFGIEGTGGSTSIANSFQQYRQAGAIARAMLVAAAAAAWGVPGGRNRRRRWRALAQVGPQGDARRLRRRRRQTRRARKDAPLKAPRDFTLIGKTCSSPRHRGEDHRRADLHPRRPARRHGGRRRHPSAEVRRDGDEVRRQQGGQGRRLPRRENHPAGRRGLRQEHLAGVQGEGPRRGRMGRIRKPRSAAAPRFSRITRPWPGRPAPSPPTSAMPTRRWRRRAKVDRAGLHVPLSRARADGADERGRAVRRWRGENLDRPRRCRRSIRRWRRKSSASRRTR